MDRLEEAFGRMVSVLNGWMKILLNSSLKLCNNLNNSINNSNKIINKFNNNNMDNNKDKDSFYIKL